MTMLSKTLDLSLNNCNRNWQLKQRNCECSRFNEKIQITTFKFVRCNTQTASAAPLKMLKTTETVLILTRLIED